MAWSRFLRRSRKCVPARWSTSSRFPSSASRRNEAGSGADHGRWNHPRYCAETPIGAVLVYFTVEKTPCMQCVTPAMSSHFQAWIMHLKNPSLRASFAIGFCILFAFIGTFTFINFVLVQPPLGVVAM